MVCGGYKLYTECCGGVEQEDGWLDVSVPLMTCVEKRRRNAVLVEGCNDVPTVMVPEMNQDDGEVLFLVVRDGKRCEISRMTGCSAWSHKSGPNMASRLVGYHG